MCEPLRSEPKVCCLEVLQQFAQSLQQWIHDPRGNAMSVSSPGHIHDSVNDATSAGSAHSTGAATQRPAASATAYGGHGPPAPAEDAEAALNAEATYEPTAAELAELQTYVARTAGTAAQPHEANADGTGDAAQLPEASADGAVNGAPASFVDAPPGLHFPVPTDQALAELHANVASTTGTPTQPPEARADGTGDAAQGPAVAADAPPAPAQLTLGDVIAIQNAEAAEFRPPRSLHGLARDALNTISLSPTREAVDLDGVFPWRQYVAAHRQSAEIIGPGITQAIARWRTGTNDCNRGGAPRLDFHFHRVDGTVCRVHPGDKPRKDARLIFETTQWQ